jgi:hypothetical protein
MTVAAAAELVDILVTEVQVTQQLTHLEVRGLAVVAVAVQHPKVVPKGPVAVVLESMVKELLVLAALDLAVAVVVVLVVPMVEVAQEPQAVLLVVAVAVLKTTLIALVHLVAVVQLGSSGLV